MLKDSHLSCLLGNMLFVITTDDLDDFARGDCLAFSYFSNAVRTAMQMQKGTLLASLGNQDFIRQPFCLTKSQMRPLIH